MKIIGMILCMAMLACMPEKAQVKEDCVRCGYIRDYQCVHTRGYECRVVVAETMEEKDTKKMWHETINNVVILGDRICRFRYRMGENYRVDYEEVKFSEKECKNVPR